MTFFGRSTNYTHIRRTLGAMERGDGVRTRFAFPLCYPGIPPDRFTVLRNGIPWCPPQRIGAQEIEFHPDNTPSEGDEIQVIWYEELT